LIEPKPVGYIRAKIRNRTDPAIRRQASEARRAVGAALRPFIQAAKALPVRLGDDEARYLKPARVSNRGFVCRANGAKGGQYC
jgi:hypothetical protein